MIPFARIRMFIEMTAIKLAEAEVITRKMCGHPVDDDADIVLVTAVDEEFEILRVAETRSRCK